MIQVKRVYERPSPSDGTRVLVDRLCPRGLAKDLARIDLWPRELAPSSELRRSYRHNRARFVRFRERYRLELFRRQEEVAALAVRAESEKVTLLCAARDPRFSNAAVLQELLEEVLESGRPGPARRTSPSTRARRSGPNPPGSR